MFIITFIAGQPTLAKWGTFTITDEHGDQVKVKHGLLGKKIVVQDRNGNGFKHSKSIFGISKKTDVAVLGNEASVHKTWFGFSKIEGHDMLGDTVSSKKNPLFRNTNVNLSGADAFLSKISSPKSSLPPNNPYMPGQSGPSPNTPITSPGLDIGK